MLMGHCWKRRLAYVFKHGRATQSRVGDALAVYDAKPMMFDVPPSVIKCIDAVIFGEGGTSIRIDSLFPAKRRMSPAFMIADATSVVHGRRDLELIGHAAPSYAGLYSDDGITAQDAYGPPYIAQRDYIISSLQANSNSRRAYALIASSNPPLNTKGIPCTLGWVFNVVGNKLVMHAMLRSSDIWVGLPNDMWVAACVARDVCRLYNPTLGIRVIITAANQHLYIKHIHKAEALLGAQK